MNKNKIISIALLSTVISTQIGTSAFANPVNSDTRISNEQAIESNTIDTVDSPEVYTDSENKEILRSSSEYMYPKEVTLNFKGTATLDGNEIKSGTKVTEPGFHTITLEGNGQTKTYSFSVINNLNGKDIVSFSIGCYNTIVLDNDNNIYLWGYDNSSNVPKKLEDKGDIPVDAKIISVKAMGSHFSAIDSEGNLYVWGRNSYGELGNGNTTNQLAPVKINGKGDIPANAKIIYSSLGRWSSSAIDSEGNLYTWGYNAHGELGNGSNKSCSAPIKINGKGDIPANAKVISSSMSGYVGSAVDSKGNLYTWGINSSGQIGDGTTTDRTSPVKINGKGDINYNTKIISSSIGYVTFSAIDSEGNLYTWGSNKCGQIGDGTTTDRTSPVKINGKGGITANTKIISSSLGDAYSSAVDSEGNLYTWGDNTYGQLGDGTTTQRNYPVKINDKGGILPNVKITSSVLGSFTNGIVDSEGNFYLCGYNGYGELGNGTKNNSSLPVETLLTMDYEIVDKSSDDDKYNIKIKVNNPSTATQIAYSTDDGKSYNYASLNNGVANIIIPTNTSPDALQVRLAANNQVVPNLTNLLKNIISTDKTALEKVLKDKISTEGMTKESVEAYDKAIDNGEKVLDNKDATQKEIDDAVAAINKAKSELKLDTSSLKDAIDKAQGILDKANLSDGLKGELNSAITKGNAVLNNPDATLNDINNALKDINNLVIRSGREELDKLIKGKVSTNNMTQESAKAYDDAIANGQKVLDNKDATEKELTDAISEIKNAINGLEKVNIESTFKEAYWNDHALVFGGIFNATNDKQGAAASKYLSIKDKDNNTIKEISAWNASWGGNNGYQCFIEKDDLKVLTDGTYKLFVGSTINGVNYEAPISQNTGLLAKLIVNNINDLEALNLENNKIKFSLDADNKIVFTKSEIKTSTNIMNMYFNGNSLVVDGTFGFEGVNLDNHLDVKLSLKDSSGNIIKTIDTYKAGWGDQNTGFQGIFVGDELSKIANGEYTLYASANLDNFDYEVKLTSNNNISKSSTINNSKFTIKGNSDSITVSKEEIQKLESQVNIKQSYWDGDNFVINGVVANMNLSKDDAKSLIIKDSTGNIINTIKTTPVDWFSSRNNFSGFQAIIPSDVLSNLSIGSYSFDINTIYQGSSYVGTLKQSSSLLAAVFSISKDINTTEEKVINNLKFKFSTNKDNEVVLNVNENTNDANAIANKTYWNIDSKYYVINGSIKFEEKTLSVDSDNSMLIFKDVNGNAVKFESSVTKGWNEENPFQALIGESTIDSLEPGTYTVYIKVTEGDQVYEAPIKTNNNSNLDIKDYQTNKYSVNLSLNSNNNLALTIK